MAGFSAGFTFEEEEDPIIQRPKGGPPSTSIASKPASPTHPHPSAAATATAPKKPAQVLDLTDSPPLKPAQLPSQPPSSSSAASSSASPKRPSQPQSGAALLGNGSGTNGAVGAAPKLNGGLALPSRGLSLPSAGGQRSHPSTTTTTSNGSSISSHNNKPPSTSSSSSSSQSRPFATGSTSSITPRAANTSSFSSLPASSAGAAFAPSAFSSSSSSSNPHSIQPRPRPTASSHTASSSSSSHNTPRLGSIPVISSASAARLPSAFLPYSSNPTSFNSALSASSSSSSSSSRQPVGNNGILASAKDYYRMQTAALLGRKDATPPTASTSRNVARDPSLSHSGSSNGGGVKREMLDLTGVGDDSDSDDSVVIDESPMCIGQLNTLALVLHCVADIQGPLPPTLFDPNGNQIPPHAVTPQMWRPPPQPPLPVHLYRGPPQNKNETLRLSTPTSHEVFGFVEHKVANVIAPLLGDGYSGTGVTTKQAKLWCEAAVIRKGDRNPMMLPLVLLLFARPIDIPYISAALANNTIYLEHPHSYNPAMHHGYRYSNPHNPLAGAREAERRRANILTGLYGGYAKQPVKKEDVQRQQVQDVFENLKSGLDVEEQEPDEIIATKLYPHQKQALSFLLDRESLIDPNAIFSSAQPPPEVIVSLWTRLYASNGKPRGWRSLVTSLEIPGSLPPPQPRGSILADDMGLGKTVVVISLVASTRKEAREWAKLAPERDVVDTRLDGMAGEGKGSKVGLDDFNSGLYGDAAGGSGGGGGHGGGGAAAAKKAENKAKREKKREDAITARHKRLVTRSAGTLIVCPLSTVQNWEIQFDEHVIKIACAGNGNGIGDKKGKEKEGAEGFSLGGGNGEEETKKSPLSVYVYHGNAREQDPIKLAQYDVVITTFSTLGSEFSRQNRAEEERQKESDDEIEIISGGGTLTPMSLSGASTPLMGEMGTDEKGKKKLKRKRKKIEGSGESPLQMIQWFRVVLDEAHIIKEHTTIQARAACELSASRRTALSGTPLQNSLNDLFSLVRFLRLEPFTDRGIWTQHIGALAKSNDPLGVSRLKLIMRHLALRRTKASTDKDGKPILSLPPNNQQIVYLDFDPAESAFYNQHHQRYKHDFKVLQATDSVMKNYCSILQELLRLRQICVHMALVRDSEDVGSGADLVKTIEQHGISKPRAIQLLGLMRDAGEAKCSECGYDMLPGGTGGAGEAEDMIEVDKKPIVKKRRTKAQASAPASAACSEDERPAGSGGPFEPVSIVTRCQHLYCRQCFQKICPELFLPPPPAPPPPPPESMDTDEQPPPIPPLKTACTVCKTEFFPRLDAVELGAKEVIKALEETAEDDLQATLTGKKSKGTRFFEHSTKTKALMRDVFPFSQANPASVNYWPEMDTDDSPKAEVIGFQPVKDEVVKSVVFSQWTKLLDRIGDELDSVNIKYGRLDGGMNRDQRGKAMETFKIDPACEILLVSLRAGGVGLNLTAGRRVYLMEPFWNPAVENQAIDRIHRLGQTMPVQTIRYVVSKSIEENMLKIQKRKTELANMSIGQTLSKSELAKRRQEDLQTLLD